MLNNMPRILDLMIDSDEVCYHVQLIARSKDTNEKTRLVHSEGLSKRKFTLKSETLIAMAEATNSRIYVNLNPKSYSDIAYEIILKLAENLRNKQPEGVTKVFDSAIGTVPSRNKIWIIDVDHDQLQQLPAIQDAIPKCRPIGSNTYIATLPTPNGAHILTRPFEVTSMPMCLCVHKNNPTVAWAK